MTTNPATIIDDVSLVLGLMEALRRSVDTDRADPDDLALLFGHLVDQLRQVLDRHAD